MASSHTIRKTFDGRLGPANTCRQCLMQRRQVTTAVATAVATASHPSSADAADLEERSSNTRREVSESTKDWNPTTSSRPGHESCLPAGQLISSYIPTDITDQRSILFRYQYRPPKYYRGPLHPHQPPRPSDPASREFIPGPFTLPSLAQTYESTIAPDMLTLFYQHNPPGYTTPPAAPRLRSWDGTSPYHKGRPLRGPRGSDVLNLVRKPITFRNLPKLERVTVHSFIAAASEGSAPLHIASMALQNITGARCTVHAAKHNVPQWGVRPGKFMSLTADLYGESMLHFLAKTIGVVLPRIRDYRGVAGTSGDDNGNITFGLTPEQVAYYPEIEINYDNYPPKMIPGCHITVHTTAKSDRDARLLLSAVGLPFTGKFVN